MVRAAYPMVNRRKKSGPSFFAPVPVLLAIVVAGVDVAALDAAALRADVRGAIRHDHLFAADLAERDGPAIAPERSVGGIAEGPNEIDGATGRDAFTAEEKETINAAVMADHPSVTVLGDPTPSYGCHGFTFAAGRLRVYGDQVEKILADQGWLLRTAGAHQVGDIAIYRKEGAIRHSGIVSAVQDGTVTRIQSKWGAAGLYEHDPGDVPDDYGQYEILHRGVALATVH